MEFRLLNKQGLQEFIDSDEFLHMPFIPITRHRALSQIHNPRAGDKDILLILAMHEGQLAGYTGVLPDHLVPGSLPLRIGWLSCLWVHPEHRNKNLGIALINKALDCWDHSILSAEYVPQTKGLYYRSAAFTDPVSIAGIRVYLRLDLETLLPPRYPVFRKAGLLLRVIDKGFNLLFDRRFELLRHQPGIVAFESVCMADEETSRFITAMNRRDLSRRGADEINWMLSQPWIVKNKQTAGPESRYYFSSTASRFGTHAFRLRKADGSIAAFFILTLRDRTLKMPVYYAADGMEGDAARVIREQMVKWRVNTFTTYQPGLVSVFSRSSPGLLTRKIHRYFMVSHRLQTVFIPGRYVVQDGEGDLAFT